MDYGHKMTDELLESLEKDITEIYANAKEDAQKKAETYFQKFEAKDKQLKALVDSGQMDEKEYRQWRTNHFMVGARYKAMADGLAADMTNANKIAASAINGHLPDVYATNYNWGTYKIEQDARMDTNFMIYDRQTVERLIRDKPELLPIKARIDVPEDMRWNKKQINGAITKGILTGASIPEMAKNLAGVADMNKVSALRNARTMTTSAENGGRIDSYQRAIDMGIKITQQWMATKDARTRDEHKQLDGQEVPVGKPFKVDGYEIKFPADPEAEPFLVYNCRCCLISNFKGFDYKKMDKYVAEKPMSYKQWEEQHKKKPKEAEKPAPPSRRPKTKEGWAYKTCKGYYGRKDEAIKAINDFVDGAPENVQKLWEMNAPKLQQAKTPSDPKKAYFSHTDHRVYFNGDRVVDGDILHLPYQNHFHEFMHNIDYLNRENGYEMFSDSWTDKKGRTLENIIMDELKSKFGVRKSDEEIGLDLFREQLIQGGVGAEGFVLGEIAEWRKRNGISFRSEEYKALKEEAQKCQNTHEYLVFYKKHASKFITDDIRKQKGFAIDKNSVRVYINNMEKNYSLKDRGNLSDMMERFTVEEIGLARPMGAGHGKDYALKTGKLSREAFAEIGDSSFVNPTALELIKKELPETYRAWETMVNTLIKGGKKK